MANEETSEQNRSKRGKNGPEKPFFFNLPRFHFLNASAFAEANDILVRTARAVWEKQAELMTLEAEQSRNALAPLKTEDGPIGAFSGFCDQWHAYSDKAIGNLREINDLVRDCEWQLLDVVAKNTAQAAQRRTAD